MEQQMLFHSAATARSMRTSSTTDPDSLRPYQRDAVNANLRELAKVRATLDVIFTGGGKTQIAGSVAKHWPGRVLWLAHRDELLEQAQRRIEAMTGELTSLEQAGWYSSGTRVVVGSVQSLRRARLERFPGDTFSLIVIDEAHHAPALTYRKIVEHFYQAKVLGITATADRMDGIGQHNVFDSVAFRKDIDAGIDEGYLVPALPRSELVDSVNLGKLHTRAGDLELDALEEEILKSAAAIADVILGTSDDRRSLCFTPGVGSAHKVCDTLNTRRPGSAHVVDAKTTTDKRREILKAHRRGDFQYLVNCLVFTEGYDDPGIRAIFNARPTKSRALATQIWGRGLRPAPGIGELADLQDRLSAIAASAKPNCLLMDITGEPGKHSLIAPLDILGGRYAPEAVERAKEMATKPGEQAQARDLLERAVYEIRAEDDERLKAEARAAAEAEVRRRAGEWDPFADSGVKDPDALRPVFARRPATLKQKHWLAARGLDTTMSCDQARQLWKTEYARQLRGLADLRVINALRKHGVTDMNVGRQAGHTIMNEVARLKGATPPAEWMAKVIAEGR